VTRRRKSKDAGGRYVVDELTTASLSAATAYAAALAMREARTIDVTEIGKGQALVRCRYDEADRSVTITQLGGPRVRA